MIEFVYLASSCPAATGGVAFIQKPTR